MMHGACIRSWVYTCMYVGVSACPWEQMCGCATINKYVKLKREELLQVFLLGNGETDWRVHYSHFKADRDHRRLLRAHTLFPSHTHTLFLSLFTIFYLFQCLSSFFSLLLFSTSYFFSLSLSFSLLFIFSSVSTSSYSLSLSLLLLLLSFSLYLLSPSMSLSNLSSSVIFFFTIYFIVLPPLSFSLYLLSLSFSFSLSFIYFFLCVSIAFLSSQFFLYLYRFQSISLPFLSMNFIFSVLPPFLLFLLFILGKARHKKRKQSGEKWSAGS